MRNTGHQQGAAIIMVLFIVALATSLAVYMTSQQSMWQRQLESQLDRAQARRVGIAAIDWARAVLADDARASTIDHADEMWALHLPAMPVESGEVIGVIDDGQGLFNLNNLVRNGSTSATDVAQFQRLLGLLGLPNDLAAALADWMDKDDVEQFPGGAEDAYYLSLEHPYRTSGRPLVELGELALVRGFDVATIERLRPFVTALPTPGPVNVNFAPPEVLAAVSNMSLADARGLVTQRRGNPFKSAGEFRQRLPHGGIQVSDRDISVSSQYFVVSGRATMGNALVTTQALLHRIGGGWPEVVWQSVQ